MHLLLTDQLSCPRCGPGTGLVLLAERVEARRVYSGALGCPSCQQKYAIRDGVADLQVEDGDAETPDVTIDVETLAALLGVAEGPAMVLLLGRFESVAEKLADLTAEVEVIVAHAGVLAGTERMGVNRLRIGDIVPLHARGMRGVALAAGASLAMVQEAARVCGIAARLVLFGATDETRAWIGQNGMRVMAEQGEILVAVRQS